MRNTQTIFEMIKDWPDQLYLESVIRKLEEFEEFEKVKKIDKSKFFFQA